jgi:hypothetical protein
MSIKQPNVRTKGLVNLLPQVFEAGLDGNKQRLELLCLNTIRMFRQDFPDLAANLGSLLSRTPRSMGVTRLQGSAPVPADLDGGLALLRLEAVDDAEEPILPAAIQETVTRFLSERAQAKRLLSHGLTPPRTLLLKGLPGTGKTMIARWVAFKMGLPLAVLDLATSISSFLGKTGTNLRRSLDYARATPCVLLLDEFDAIGKRRDDVTEIGELKRIVNVLLKELEDWSLTSVLVAATNHPELLDHAIHRRFDVVLETRLPSATETEAIIRRATGTFATQLADPFVTMMARMLAGRSGSEITTMVQSAVRHHVLAEVPLPQELASAVVRGLSSGERSKELGTVIRQMQSEGSLTVRDIAAITGKSSSTVQYHLSKNPPNATAN